MSIGRRVLVAARKSDLAWALHHEVSRLSDWQLIGIIDPRLDDTFVHTCALADVVLIDAEDLIWLWQNRGDATRQALEFLRTVVILNENQILDIVPRLPMQAGLLLRDPQRNVPLDRLELALKGYIAISGAFLDRLTHNRLRLDIAAGFTRDEAQVLSHVGRGLTNRQIATALGLPENRIKTLVHLVTHKLGMDNRTSVAMFAASNALIDVNSESITPKVDDQVC